MSAPVIISGLTPYSGPWGWDQAAHLLRRTLFGPSKAEIVNAQSVGLNATITQLLAVPTLPSPPVNHFSPDDPKVAIGEVWLDKSHNSNIDVGLYRYPSIRGWYWQNLIHHDFNIMSKMTMFWINHFGMSDVAEHRAEYQSIAFFNEFGTSNFKTIIEEITVLPSMLSFLNGDSNSRWTPNENFARELLELFTIQKGQQVSTEDYTNYTEDDIRAAAQILTGWRNTGFWSTDIDVVESYFQSDQHSPGIKTMSYRFDNAEIGSDDPNYDASQEFKELINVIFGKAETARAFCRELYRFFVYYDITSAIESQVIEPMAQCLITNNFEIKPVMQALLGSQHFFDMAVRGPMIKSPYEFIVSIARPLGGFSHLGLDLSGVDNLQTRYDLGISHHWWANNMEMDFLFPPTVAGWKAYYQTPTYYRNWIGSATLKQRKSLVDSYTGDGVYTQTNGGGYDPRPLDYFSFVAALETPFDPNELVAECVQIFLPRELDPLQIDALKEQLIPGLPDSEWSRQYADYLANPFNPDVVNPVRNKLRAFFRGLFSLAEFNLQ